jgi:LysM repeat protein
MTSLPWRPLLAAPIAAVALLFAWAGATQATAQQNLPVSVADEVRADVAERADVDPQDVDMVRADAVTWADACLAAPEEGEFCAQVLVDGFVVWAEADNVTYRYHTDEDGSEVRLARQEEDVDHEDLAIPDEAQARDVEPPAEVTYVVQPGDTLFSIALAHGTSVGLIADANNIADPNVIHVGQTLTIPEPMPTPPAEPAPPEDTYTVQSGDTLFAIASQFGTTVSAFVEANNLADPNVIFAGQVLVVPDDDEAPDAEPGNGYISHTVEPGDTLFSLANEHGTTVQAIVDANHPAAIGPGHLIRVGDVLLIPVE